MYSRPRFRSLIRRVLETITIQLVLVLARSLAGSPTTQFLRATLLYTRYVPRWWQLRYGIRNLLTVFSKLRTKRVDFIQIGSNDGKQGDPLFEFIVAGKWSGILVEPVSAIFKRLSQNYQRCTNLVFENVAISSTSGVKDFYRLRDTDEALPEWYDQMGTLDRSLLERFASELIPDFQERIIIEKVTCMTFAELVARHKRASVDLLHIDAEGHDFEILKGIDLTKFPIELILFEHYHLEPEDYTACKRHLDRHGYESFAIGNDTFAIRARQNRTPEARS